MSGRKTAIVVAAIVSVVALIVIGDPVLWARKLIDVIVIGGAVKLSWRRLHPRRPRRGRTMLELAAAAIGGGAVAHKRDTRRQTTQSAGRTVAEVTHPCSGCGHPIGAPSRAAYCSPQCRQYARLEREQTERRARQLTAFGDVPDGFGDLPEGY